MRWTRVATGSEGQGLRPPELAYGLHQGGGHEACGLPRAGDDFCGGADRRHRVQKTPRLAGCGATSPLFFCRAHFGVLHAAVEKFTFAPMDGAQQTAIHQALVAVQHAVTTMTFPSCDQGDVIELIDRIEEQLQSSHPNVPMMCTFLNSIARSLRAQPEAREVCLVIEDAIEEAGLPSTWQSGI